MGTLIVGGVKEDWNDVGGVRHCNVQNFEIKLYMNYNGDDIEL